MTRWLQAAKMASGVFDTTDTTDKTPISLLPGQRHPETQTGCHKAQNTEVLSVVSVVSKGGKPDFGKGECIHSPPSRHDPEALQMDFEERAAILEFDAGFSRQEAERRAHLEIYGRTVGKGENQ